jgi:hypothetical protein
LLFNMTNPVIEGMRERGFGRIVSFSSINGQKGQTGKTNYAASKVCRGAMKAAREARATSESFKAGAQPILQRSAPRSIGTHSLPMALRPFQIVVCNTSQFL